MQKFVGLRCRHHRLADRLTIAPRDEQLDGKQAVDMAEQIRSVRVVDRLAPLEEAARQRHHHGDVRDLAERIATLRSG